MDYWTNPATGVQLRCGDIAMNETLRSLPTSFWCVAGTMPIRGEYSERINTFAATETGIEVIREKISEAVQNGLLEPGYLASVSEHYLTFFFKLAQTGSIPVNVGLNLTVQHAEDARIAI